MNAGLAVELGLIAVVFVGLIVTCLIDPAHLVEKKAEREAQSTANPTGPTCPTNPTGGE